MNKQLSNRLLALEATRKNKLGKRMFTGYEATGLYYECGAVNYRLGLNGEAEPGQTYTKAELDALERAGWDLTVIVVTYRTILAPDETVLAHIQPGYLEML